jgi:HSP20 family molecular chaperone IbpA
MLSKNITLVKKMDDIENKLRDAIIDALKTYFKSGQVDSPSGEELSGEVVSSSPEAVRETDESKNYPAPNREKSDADADEGDFEEDGEKIDFTNLFHFPEAQPPHKSLSFLHNPGSNAIPPGIKGSEEIDPKIMEDFLDFMGLLGVTPDDIADTVNEMAKVSLTREKFPTAKPVSSIPAQKELFHDIFQDEKKVTVIVELPGLAKDEIELHVARNEIELNGNSIRIPSPIDPDNVKARLNNGILEINLQKILG